jgi:hypothetical protein
MNDEELLILLAVIGIGAWYFYTKSGSSSNNTSSTLSGLGGDLGGALSDLGTLSDQYDV